jgi:hypothetical protein
MKHIFHLAGTAVPGFIDFLMRFITRLLFYRSTIKTIDPGCFGDLLLAIERVRLNSGKKSGDR